VDLRPVTEHVVQPAPQLFARKEKKGTTRPLPYLPVNSMKRKGKKKKGKRKGSASITRPRSTCKEREKKKGKEGGGGAEGRSTCRGPPINTAPPGRKKKERRGGKKGRCDARSATTLIIHSPTFP